jgi:hypothetical protein
MLVLLDLARAGVCDQRQLRMAAAPLFMPFEVARAGAGLGEVLGRTLFLRLPTAYWCGSSMAGGPVGCRGEAWLEKGVHCSR